MNEARVNQTMGADGLVRCHSEWNAIKTLEVLLYQNFPLTFQFDGQQNHLRKLRERFEFDHPSQICHLYLIGAGCQTIMEKKSKICS